MDENSEGCTGLLIIIGIIGLGWFAYKEYQNYLYGEKRPFWSGTKVIQVCKKPYYSSDECYRLPVTLIDSQTARINFDNGGYKYSYDLTCYFTTHIDEITYAKSRYVFCRSWDSDGQQWDFAPFFSKY